MDISMTTNGKKPFYLISFIYNLSRLFVPITCPDVPGLISLTNTLFKQNDQSFYF